jgi:hypothetical protein
MVGTPLVAGWIAELAFWALLGVGFFSGELRGRSVAMFVIVWALGFVGLPHLGSTRVLLVTPYVGVLDVVLVLVVVKGNVRLT